MALLRQELRKIWQPWILISIAALGALYYFLFPSFYIQHFCNGPSAQAQFDLAAGWAERYGTTMELSERAELDGQLIQEKETFARQIAAIPEAAARGLTGYDSFQDFFEAYYKDAAERDGAADMDTEKLIWRVIGGTNYYTVETLCGFMDSYDNLDRNIPPNLNYTETGDSPAFEEKKLARIESTRDSAALHGYLPTSIGDSTNEYAKDLTVWAVLSVVLLLSPTLVRDRLHRMQSAQWASRRGRGILGTQLVAAGLSALGLTALNLAAYGIPFLSRHPLIFRDFSLFTIFGYPHPWFDWSYGQYLLILMGMIAALALAAAGLTAALSRYSGSYVAMLLKALPLFVALKLLCADILVDQAFFFGNRFSNLLAFPGAEAAGTAVLLASSVLLCFIIYRRQLRREL